jgi:hypothetical protein
VQDKHRILIVICPYFIVRSLTKSSGLEIWRIEKLVPTPVPKQFYGKFYVGDSYIILHVCVVSLSKYAKFIELLQTKKKQSALEWDIYFWLGSESSQVKSFIVCFIPTQYILG